MSLERIGSLLHIPHADEFIKTFGGNPNNIEVLTFWSVESAYPSNLLRYHLGQLGTISLMNQLAEKGCTVQAFVCDPDSRSLVGGGTAKPGLDIHVAERFIRLLADTSIQPRMMSHLIENLLNTDSKGFTGLADCAVRGAQKFRECIQEHRPPQSVLDRLSQFRALQENLSLDTDLKNFVEKLRVRCPNIPPAELLSSLYASVRRPKWFDAFWMGDMAAWLSLYVKNRQGGADSAARRVVLLEANRSAYSWMTHRCFLNIGLQAQGEDTSSIVWPEMCFADPLLSTDGASAMQLSQSQQAIFLAQSQSVIEKRLRASTDRALESYQRWLLPLMHPAASRKEQEKALLERICHYRKVVDDNDAALLTRPAEPPPAVAGPQADARIGLCLSGGGFRATFFHLGLIKLLRDAGLLNRVSAVYSVSGGSILAANRGCG